MKRFLFAISTVVLSLAFFSCSDDNNPTTPSTPVHVPGFLAGTATASGITVELWADDTLRVGYNTLYVRLKDGSGAVLRSAHIAMEPVMDMGSMQHGAPSEQPTSRSGDFFAGAAVFTMPSGNGEAWSMQVDVIDSVHQTSAQVVVPINVVKGVMARVVQGSDLTVYTIAMLPMPNADVGMNDIEFAVYKIDDTMAYTPVEDFDISMTPDMPSMGHGSPNNIDPVHTKLGHYKGKVNFTMTGEWRITVQLGRGSEHILGTSFKIVF